LPVGCSLANRPTWHTRGSRQPRQGPCRHLEGGQDQSSRRRLTYR
jgi:hypothetical protein